MTTEADPYQASAENLATQTEAFIRVGPLMSVPALLREFGCSPEQILGEAGLDLTQFDDPDTKISFLIASKMLARCVTATDCQHFGLLMGARAGSSSLGLAGFIPRFAPTVGAALQALLSHLELHDTGGAPVVTTCGDVSSLGYAVHLAEVDAVDLIYDLSTVMSCNMMRDLCGRSWNPTQVLLTRQPPTDTLPYERFFRAPIQFNAQQNAVTFSTQLLNNSLVSADPALFYHLKKEAEALHESRPANTTELVRRLLRTSLPDGHSTSSTIARQLGIHERTLHRHLKKEGTTFRCALKDIRYEAARQLLANSRRPISEIATALGYGETSTFIRSFRRWSGITPALWRTRNAGRSYGGE